MAAERPRLTLGISSFLVFLIITAFVFSNASQSLDAQLALAINHASLGGAFTTIMVLFADYGREYFWIPVVGVMLVLGKKDMKLLAIELAVLFVVGIVIGDAIKFVVYRPRPFETIDAMIRRLPVETDSSYPSGHALIVSIGAAFSLVKFKEENRSSALDSRSRDSLLFACLRRDALSSGCNRRSISRDKRGIDRALHT